MRALFLVCLLGCKGGADEAARDIAREEEGIAHERKVAEKALAPLRELQGRYEKAAVATIAAHTPVDGTIAIDVAKGRKIAPILATKLYPHGEQRPVNQLWCSGRCENEPWIAPEPAAAGVLVIADAKIIEGGKWISEGRYGGDQKELGKAYIHQYDVRAVLVPENVVVARWLRFGMIPGINNHELMPVRGEELLADMTALFDGRAPVERGELPKTSLGGY